MSRLRHLAASACLATVLLAPNGARADTDDFWGRDKALHFGFSAVIASGTYAVSASFFDARYPPLLLGAGVSLGLGTAKELADLAVEVGGDAVADVRLHQALQPVARGGLGVELLERADEGRHGRRRVGPDPSNRGPSDPSTRV